MPRSANQTPEINAFGWSILAAIGATTLYLIFRPQKASAVPATGCTVVENKVDAWIAARGLQAHYIYYSYGDAPPANWAAFLQQAQTTWPQSSAQGLIHRGNSFVITVMNSGFWRYDSSGQPVFDGIRKSDYCMFAANTTG